MLRFYIYRYIWKKGATEIQAADLLYTAHKGCYILLKSVASREMLWKLKRLHLKCSRIFFPFPPQTKCDSWVSWFLWLQKIPEMQSQVIRVKVNISDVNPMLLINLMQILLLKLNLMVFCLLLRFVLLRCWYKDRCFSFRGPLACHPLFQGSRNCTQSKESIWETPNYAHHTFP